jgi:hypothetical protein
MATRVPKTALATPMKPLFRSVHTTRTVRLKGLGMVRKNASTVARVRSFEHGEDAQGVLDPGADDHHEVAVAFGQGDLVEPDGSSSHQL